MRGKWVSIGGLLFGTWLAGSMGCADAESVTRNLVIVSIDTLRADHLGAYGYSRPTSPHIDSLAARGVVFEAASAPAPWTFPSHASLLTGLYPSHHGAVQLGRSLSAEVDTLASLLAGRGFDTHAIVNSAQLKQFGMERGWSDLEYIAESADRRTPFGTIDAGVAWLKGRNEEERFFLFLHLYDVHSDYKSLPEYEERFVGAYSGFADGTTRQLVRFRLGRLALDATDAGHLIDLYDAGIRQTDDRIGRLLVHLDESGLSKDTLVILTSDHGEEFLEHGGVLHGSTHFQEVVGIPLILAGPGLPAGRRVGIPVSLVDVLPTALAALDVAPPSRLDGVPLQPLIRDVDAAPDRVIFMEADHSPLGMTPDSKRAARWRDFKLHYDIYRRNPRLFDLRNDPEERNDVGARHPEVRQRLVEALVAFLDDARSPSGDAAPHPALDPESVELLESLGYLQGAETER